MGLNAKKVAGGFNAADRVQQPNIEPGSYPARLVSVVDLGVQASGPSQFGVKPPAQVIRVTYELTDVFMLDKDGEELEDKPRWISEEFKLYNLEMERGTSTKRYKAIDPELEKDGDWSELLGRGVMVGVVNNAKGGKVYDNVGITSVMRKRDLDKLPELKNTPYFFDLTAPDPDIWKKIPQWLQDKIQNNLNYENSPLQEMLGGAAPAAKKEAPKKAAPAPVEDGDDDAPDQPVGEDAPW